MKEIYLVYAVGGLLVLIGWLLWLVHLEAESNRKERELLEQKLMARDFSEYYAYTVGGGKLNRSLPRDDERQAEIEKKGKGK